MPITSSDLWFKYTGTGSTTNPEQSLGGSLNPNTIPSGVANNVFDDVTGQESQSGNINHYRAIGIHNTLTTHIWMNTSIRVDGYERASNTFDIIYFGVERPQGTEGNPDGTIQTISSETVEPSGITWTEEGNPSAWVQISGADYVGSIGPDDWAGIWLKRTIPPGAEAYNNRSCTIRVQGETSASPYVYPVSVVFTVNWTRNGLSIQRAFDRRLIARIVN